jgi:co-chaperonin GroES (HSP10)
MFDVRTLNIQIPQTPRGNRLLVLPLVKAGSSPILSMEENREQPERGLVLATGPGGVGTKTGNPVPVESKVGELVCYGKYAGMKHEIAGPPDAHGRSRPLVVYILADSEVLLAQPAETLDLIVHDGDPRKIHEQGHTCESCPAADLAALQQAAYGEAPAPVLDVDAAIAAERARAEEPLIIPGR